MKLKLSSVSVSASGKASGSAGVEDNRSVRVTAGKDLDVMYVDWVTKKAQSMGLRVSPVPNKAGGTTYLFFKGDDAAKLVLDFGQWLSPAVDGEWNGKQQRTYWLGAPMVEVDLGAFGE